MKFETCYLHIGGEKTGSTTIQRFLEGNRSKLQQAGHYYPRCLGPKRGSHYYLVVYSLHDEVFDDLRLITTVTNKQELIDFRNRLEGDIQHEFSRIEQCDTIHISCENLQSRLQSPQAIKRVKELLQPWVKNFKVIVYVRPQHEVALSLYSTDMKLGGVKKDPLPAVSENNHYYNYEVMLDKWSKLFGHKNIIVRNFQRHALIGNDVIADYLFLTGINTVELDPIKKENKSLAPDALEFLGQLNKYLPRFVDNQPTTIRKNIDRLMEELFPGQGATTSRDRAKRFFAIFELSNSNIAKKYLNKDNLFEVEFDKYPESHATSAMSNEEVLEFISKFLTNVVPLIINNDSISPKLIEKLYPDNERIDKTKVKAFFSSEYIRKKFGKNTLKAFAEVWKCSLYEIKEK